jgi:hypothetical protein
MTILSLNERVRHEAQNRGGTFSYADLGDKLGIQSRAGLESVKRAVRYLIESGEMVRVKPGWFNWQWKKPGQPQIQEVMWRVLRARKAVTVPDLMELAGATKEYAGEFLRRLKKQGVIQELNRLDGIWVRFRLVDDPGPELPKNEAKGDYLRNRRMKHKAALAAIDGMYLKAHELMQATAQARVAVSELEEG